MERTELIGNVGQNARINEVNGRYAINFSVACNRRFKQADGTEVNKTNWYNCAYWRDQNESKKVADYLTSGTKVFVSGTLQPRLYKDQNGNNQISLDLNVTHIELLGGKPDEEKQNQQGTRLSAEEAQRIADEVNKKAKKSHQDDTDLPF